MAVNLNPQTSFEPTTSMSLLRFTRAAPYIALGISVIPIFVGYA